MSARALVALAGLGSLFLGGLAPCPMCIWQRWPHLAAILIAAAALAAPGRTLRPLALAGALAAAITAGLGVYHAGVERGWWQGPTDCSGFDPTGLTPEELLAQLANAPLVRCDEIAWALAGVSMAGWNAILSCGLIILWLSAAMRAERSPR